MVADSDSREGWKAAARRSQLLEGRGRHGEDGHPYSRIRAAQSKVGQSVRRSIESLRYS